MDELRRKIGQLLLVGFRGLEFDSHSAIARDLRDRNLGGVILFNEELADPSFASRNVESAPQLKRLVHDLQAAARAPLFVAIDQEGGRVSRLKPEHGFPPTLSHAELGALRDPARTFSEADSIAATLASLGVNLNLAPVVDLDAHPNNPIIAAKGRSFSRDPEVVARHAAEFCRAHQQRGILSCAKHFPGHGSARGDTHLGMVDVTETWGEAELIPFRQLIEPGRCDLVMTAHVIHRMLDPEWPATLSKPVVTGLLREKLGFAGVVISDDLQMKAISDNYDLKTALELSLHAGIDLLCFANNSSFDEDITSTVIEEIAALVAEGRIAESRLDESLQRINRLKTLPAFRIKAA